ncbi:hypothetical protein [Streptomyces sp. NBC_01451]|uniref:hypothetical protein n=1 Tax=Streptomyces sp. NBC_01451 TaxID=2903872 RepID=UPI002E2FD48A|nr:hypothetical protein [Streptomyces sp. NBC_01451]
MADACEKTELDIYAERAHLLAVMVALFGGALSYTDPQTPDWPVLYVESPTGQLSWHIHPDDVWLFPNVPVVDNYPWDKHTTRVKYKRVRNLVAQLPKLTYAKPEYGNP